MSLGEKRDRELAEEVSRQVERDSRRYPAPL